MDSCLHDGARPRVCPHQLDPDEPPDFYVRFTGRGGEHHLLCPDCAELDAPPLAAACESCFAERNTWIFSALGLQGRPEVRARESGLSFVHRAVDLDAPPFAALAPLADGLRSTWLGVDEARALRRIRLEEGRTDALAELDLTPPLRIETSPDGRFAAVVESKGGRGRVYDLETGRLRLRLVRGDYHLEHCEFPAAFVMDGARPLLVHGTDWNRLDLSDPATGELLTKREPAKLDFFHGRLTVSPDGRWLVDDGWVWHPVGSLRRCDLRRWRENVHETEDGPSFLELRQVSYFWDGPSCFVDDRTLAAWGFGWDADVMVDAAVLVDVESRRTLRWFAGPRPGRFFFDRHLLVAGEGGTSAWDVETGERLLEDPGFSPVARHPIARRFVAPRPGGLIESRWA